MLTLDHTQTKTPQQLRRLAALADVSTTDLVNMTGLDLRTINNYFNDSHSRKNYLFQFALEYLAEVKLSTEFFAENIAKQEKQND